MLWVLVLDQSPASPAVWAGGVIWWVLEPMNAALNVQKFKKKLEKKYNQISGRQFRHELRDLIPPTNVDCYVYNTDPDLNNYVIPPKKLKALEGKYQLVTEQYTYELYLNAVDWLKPEKARYLQRSIGRRYFGDQFIAFRLYNLQFPIIRDPSIVPLKINIPYSSEYAPLSPVVGNDPYSPQIVSNTSSPHLIMPHDVNLATLCQIRDGLVDYGYPLRIIDLLSIIYDCTEKMFEKHFRGRRHFVFKPFTSILDKIFYRQKRLSDLVRGQPGQQARYQDLIEKLSEEWVRCPEGTTRNGNHVSKFYRYVTVTFLPQDTSPQTQVSWSFPLWVELQRDESSSDDHHIYEIKRLQRGNTFNDYLNIEINSWNQPYAVSSLEEEETLDN